MEDIDNFEMIRQMHTVLVLHFIEGEKQSDIAERLNLSKSKVNRLIAEGRRLGLVKIAIETPFQRLLTIEEKLMAANSLRAAVVAPTIAGNPDLTLRQVTTVAGNHFLESLQDGDVIAITGGKAVSEVVENLKPERKFDVKVVPLTGGVQGKFFTDVNNLVSKLAEKLGGEALVIHAPLFTEDKIQRDMLMNVSSIKEIFTLSRRATVALVGIGSILPMGSSYYDLHPLNTGERDELIGRGVVAEFMAHLIHDDGSIAQVAMNNCLVAVNPSEIKNCSRIIGVASGDTKIRPIMAALKGGFITSLVTDEETAEEVIKLYEEISQ
ncbi:MAG: sugar-binding transcriptional regulator [Alphaproteobacteria bacterium]